MPPLISAGRAALAGACLALAGCVFFPSSQAEITSFTFRCADNAGLSCAVPGMVYQDEVTAWIDPYASARALVPTITVSKGASLSPASGKPQDFSQPQSYTVTAANGERRSYTVSLRRGIAMRPLTGLAGSVSTFVGAMGQPGGQDGRGSDARFYYPWGICTDGLNLYVTDMGSYTIRKIVIATGEVSTVAGGYLQQGTSDGIGSAARFFAPKGIATDGESLYVADNQSTTMLRKISLATGEVTTLRNTGFNDVTNLATDGSYLYLADFNSTSQVAAVSLGDFSQTPITAGGAVNPTGVVADGESYYFTNYNDVNIFRGFGLASPSGVGAFSAIMQTSLAFDGRFFYATNFNNYVAVYDARSATAGQIGSGQFNQPEGITTDGRALYVTDMYDSVIRVIR